MNIYDVLKETEYGSYGRFIGHTTHGIHHELRSPLINTIPEGDAIVFFTKPYFNMRGNNLRGNRILTNLITYENYDNVGTLIRQTLDPDLIVPGDTNRIIDRESPWIPVLTNTLKSMSGWPDRIQPTYTSQAGARGEQYSMVDGVIDINGKFDLTMTFDKMDGDINGRLLETWMLMQSLQVDGIVWPYNWQEAYYEKNYDTSIFVLIMDVTNRFVIDIGRCISAFPINDNKGSKFNINNRRTEKVTEFSVRFDCNLAEYSDPINILEFNLATARWNKEVYNLMFESSHNLELVPRNELYKYKSLIPYIDLNTNELLWYKGENSQ